MPSTLRDRPVERPTKRRHAGHALARTIAILIVLAGFGAAAVLAVRAVQRTQGATSSGPVDTADPFAPYTPTTALVIGTDSVHSVIENADGSVNVTERMVGFWLPAPTVRASAALNGVDGKMEGADTAQYSIAGTEASIFVVWQRGDPTGQAHAIVERVAAPPGLPYPATVSDWRAVPSAIGTAIAATATHGTAWNTTVSQKLLVLITNDAVVVIKYDPKEPAGGIDAVFKSITIDGKPAF
jgi:hypothetical protein